MQLVAYGAQDIYLTGNPQITFFKVVYRRHTNFSMEAIEQTWNGTEFGTSAGRCTATISRNGDLVHRMYLEITSSNFQDGISNPSANAITDIELEIGGQKIDKHTGTWMNVWSMLSEKNPTGTSGLVGSAANTGTGTLFQNMSGLGGVCTHNGGAYKAWVPLYFWFCRNPGLALPLIALQYHEVKVILNHNFGTANGWSAVTQNKLWCDYIYLDTDERRRFAQVSHEYLIEQVQEQSLNTGAAAGTDLNFNHPVKELVWHKNSGVNTPMLSVSSDSDATYQLKLNGHDRFAARDYRYFTRTQVWEHHSGPGGLKTTDGSQSGDFSDGIAVYSFAP